MYLRGNQKGELNELYVLNDVWYSSDGIQWIRATENAAFSKRAYHKSVVYDDEMWVIGGLDKDGCKNDVWCSNDGKNWKLVTSSAAFQPRYSQASFVLDNKMWVMGGIGGVSMQNIWWSK
jgi:hypothetical protein